jgi:hypothetical protein
VYKPEDDLYRVITPEKRIIYMMHPQRFIEEMIFGLRAKKFGGKYEIYPDQLEILDAFTKNRRTAVRAGRGPGKTAMISWLIIWWLCMFEGSQAVAMAPSFPQLSSVLWPEVAKWLEISAVKDFFVHTAKRLYLIGKKDITFAEPRTAAKEESAQGLHADFLFIVLDEAPGIEDKIWTRLEGSVTGDTNKILMMGNPSKTSGFFYDAFHSDKTWARIHINSEKSLNVSPRFIEEMRSKYVHGGVIHDIYRVHVLGDFPTGDVDAFMKMGDVEDASRREDTVPREGTVEIGVDVARKGDDLTCISVRVGNYFDDLILMNRSKINETVDKVLSVVEEVREDTGYDDIIRIKVDDTGVGGGVTDYLDADRDHNIEVIPCNFGGAGNEHYSDEATVMWAALRDNIHNIRLPEDRELVEELSARRWEPDQRGRPKLESKKVFKKEFGKSPDRADAVVLAIADKENELRFVKSFDHVKDGGTYHSNELSSGTKYCAMYLDKRGRTNAVFATYMNDSIRVFDEYIGDTSDITAILNQHGTFAKIIGSKDMFNLGTDDMYMQYSQRGIYLSEAYNYDEPGSLKNLENIASQDRLKVAIECDTLKKQLRTWTMAKDIRNQSDEFGLNMALLHIVSELVGDGSIITNESYERAYPQTNSLLEPNVNANFLSC